jgi:hypothetical protein
MTIPTDTKDRAIYHTILAEMHRLHATLLNMRTLDDPHTADSLREHFGREQTLALARLREWRQRRPEIYREASNDFEGQRHREPETGGSPST